MVDLVSGPNGPVVKTPPSSAGGVGLIPGWGTEVSHAMYWGQQNKAKHSMRKYLDTVTQHITQKINHHISP